MNANSAILKLDELTEKLELDQLFKEIESTQSKFFQDPKMLQLYQPIKKRRSGSLSRKDEFYSCC